jgi:hypothetical protein
MVVVRDKKFVTIPNKHSLKHLQQARRYNGTPPGLWHNVGAPAQ